MRKVLNAALAGGVLVAGGPAHAQSWGVYVGNGWGYHRPYRDYDDDDWRVRFICSGQRAHALEQRLRHEVNEGEIDGWTANRMHDAIDRLEDKQDHECREGDWRAIRAISYRYDRIAQWMDNEAHGPWRRRW